MLKKELRLKYSKLRENKSQKELLDLSLIIANNLLKIPIWSFNYYHIFLSISKKNEIDTQFILSILQGKDKNIVIPKTEGDSAFTNYLLTDSMLLKDNKWGVPEPVDGIEVPPKKIDVVFLPLLAFDKQGNRVGYGKGFYDRFLRECNPNVVKVGLSLFLAEEVITDIHEEDVPMDYCITPEKIYMF